MARKRAAEAEAAEEHRRRVLWREEEDSPFELGVRRRRREREAGRKPRQRKADSRAGRRILHGKNEIRGKRCSGKV